jgi:hypothetical protein
MVVRDLVLDAKSFYQFCMISIAANGVQRGIEKVTPLFLLDVTEAAAPCIAKATRGSALTELEFKLAAAPAIWPGWRLKNPMSVRSQLSAVSAHS